MRGCLKIAFLAIAIAAAVFAGVAVWASRHSFPPMPTLHGKIERGVLEHGGRMRTWIAFLPAKPATHPALVIALHVYAWGQAYVIHLPWLGVAEGGEWDRNVGYAAVVVNYSATRRRNGAADERN
jgi:hypothetical protein